MSDTDPLARERFRTVLTDIVRRTDIGASADVIAEESLRDFPGAHFEYRTNEAGVRMRRVVAVSEWEVDPNRDPRPHCEVVDGPCPSNDCGVICSSPCEEDQSVQTRIV